MTSSWTVRQVVERAVALGLVDEPADPWGYKLDEPFENYGKPDRPLLGLLEVLGIVFEADYKLFRGLSDGTDEERLEIYQYCLEEVAGATRGRITLTDVELVDVEGEQRLRFRSNGKLVEWPLVPGEHEEVEAQLTFGTNLEDLLPADLPQEWCHVDSPYEPGDAPAYIFADPAALAELARPFGLTFHTWPRPRS